MWGNLIVIPVDTRETRSIPTHVGKPNVGLPDFILPEVYPHACGETSSAPTAPRCSMGLSPRMWGNRCTAQRTCFALRSIPTHVGKPDKNPSTIPGVKVYPHACGETSRGSRRIDRVCGLSPRMWGNLHSTPCPGAPQRSIPTHVGKPR